MSDEKTEKPTPKKLRDARKKGQVAHSKDVVSTATICAMFLLLLATSDTYLSHLSILIELPAQYMDRPFLEALPMVVDNVLHELIYLTLMPIGVVMVSAILANFLQVGALFAVESLKPDLKKLNPVEGFKKIFSVKNLIEFIKSLIKVGVLSYLVYMLIKENLNDSARLHYCEVECIPNFVGTLLKQLILYSAITFIALAAADFFIQKQQFIKQQKMSKDEVKREYKQMEGSPEIKGKRKQIHREMMNTSVPAQVKKCSAIVTNPTHLAVGIYYEKGVEDVPKVIVKGADQMAKVIRKIAEEEGIPMMENVPLARGLWKRAQVNDYVPPDLFEAVAAVLQWVDSLDQQKQRR
ncbi:MULTISPECIES: type III secretion system export apparatus subunit SctU [unclassified Hahella]|uniref:type III secretion system export apparatus subunit SctU n=1 Tax=unclassified Hahella TaxID=2624107 RepID=UPI001C1F1BC3|nr:MULTISPECIES: type III secretion system export apparatus subunit SctU [unclassified Hahella]MBU6949816.1 type III secretion system export apparatus subunit SctU [Hahella sp. HN01]MDG9668393.1 type III secretion system export apparatus subunit SctU [Hahella sp. CR1]